MSVEPVFLGIIAVASLIHAAFLVALVVAGFKLVTKVETIERNVEKDIRELHGDIVRIIRNVADLSETLRTEGSKVGAFVDDTTEGLRKTTGFVSHALGVAVTPLVTVGAVFTGIRKAFEVYQLLRGRGRRPVGGWAAGGAR